MMCKMSVKLYFLGLYIGLIVAPPDTTTLALVNSGLSLTFSSSPTHDDRSLPVSAAGAVRQRITVIVTKKCHSQNHFPGAATYWSSGC